MTGRPVNEPTTLFVTPGPDQSLWLYTEADLERVAGRLDETPSTDAEARVYRRLYFAQAEAVDLDKAGRLLIPERLVQFAPGGGESRLFVFEVSAGT